MVVYGRDSPSEERKYGLVWNIQYTVKRLLTDTSELRTPLYNGHLPKSRLNPRSFCTLEPPEQRTPLYSVQRTLLASRVHRRNTINLAKTDGQCGCAATQK